MEEESLLTQIVSCARELFGALEEWERQMGESQLPKPDPLATIQQEFVLQLEITEPTAEQQETGVDFQVILRCRDQVLQTWTCGDKKTIHTRFTLHPWLEGGLAFLRTLGFQVEVSGEYAYYFESMKELINFIRP